MYWTKVIKQRSIFAAKWRSDRSDLNTTNSWDGRGLNRIYRGKDPMTVYYILVIYVTIHCSVILMSLRACTLTSQSIWLITFIIQRFLKGFQENKFYLDRKRKHPITIQFYGNFINRIFKSSTNYLLFTIGKEYCRVFRYFAHTKKKFH